MEAAVDLLLQHLKSEQARGVEHVFLDEGARRILRELHRRVHSTSAAPPRAETAPKVDRPTARGTGAAARPAEPQPTAAGEPPARPEAPPLEVAGATAADKLASLRAQAADWAPAKRLGSLRPNLVFSTGAADADLMLVGEAPGYHEERAAEPFVGPAGQKLDRILEAMGIERGDIYISNIVKFRPAMAQQTKNNRKPTAEEMAACLPFVREEIRIVQPRCLVALGGTAAEGLLGLSGAVGAMRGKWHEFEGIPARVTYHPAYLLHGSAGLADRRKIWEDMLAVMEQLGMAISDRQRRFFLPKGSN